MKKALSIFRKLTILILLFTLAHCMKAERIDTDINGPKGLNNIIGIWAIALLAATQPTYTGAQFVAVGNNGVAWWSNDGINWTATSFPASANGGMNALAFNGIRWVGVGHYNAGGCGVWYSDDGKSWTVSQCPSGGDYTKKAVAFGSNMFLAAGGDDGTIIRAMKSADGITWEDFSTNISTANDISSMIFEAQTQRFIAVTVAGISNITDGISPFSTIGGPLSGMAVSLRIRPGASAGNFYVQGVDISNRPYTWRYSATNATLLETGAIDNSTTAYLTGPAGFASGNGNYVALWNKDSGGFASCRIYSAATNISSSWTQQGTETSAPFGVCYGASYEPSTIAYSNAQQIFVAGGSDSSMPGLRFTYSMDGISWRSNGTSFGDSIAPNAIGVAE